MSAIDTPNFFKKDCTKYEDIWTFVFIGDCIFYVEFSFTNEGTHWRFFKNGRQLSCTTRTFCLHRWKKSNFIMFEIDSDVWETRANKDM